MRTLPPAPRWHSGGSVPNTEPRPRTRVHVKRPNRAILTQRLARPPHRDRHSECKTERRRIVRTIKHEPL